MKAGRWCWLLVAFAALWCAAAEEEEEKASPLALGISTTLLGIVSFFITLMYGTNHTDCDMRRITYSIISKTISIFCAVLVYTGLSRWLGKMILGSSEPNSGLECLFFSSLFVLWFVGLELTVGYSAGLLCIGALHDEDLDKEQWVVEENMRCSHQEQMLETSIVFARWGRGVAMGPDGYPVFLRQRNLIMEHVDRRMKCWGTIMAHAAGFAAIHAGAMLQHTGWFAQGRRGHQLLGPQRRENDRRHQCGLHEVGRLQGRTLLLRRAHLGPGHGGGISRERELLGGWHRLLP